MAANNTVAVAITTIGTAGRISPLYVPNAHPFQFRVRQMDWMEHSASMAHVIYLCSTESVVLTATDGSYLQVATHNVN